MEEFIMFINREYIVISNLTKIQTGERDLYL